MTRLSDHYARYLEFRRGLGFDLETSARVLRRFVAFADTEGADHITTDLLLRWKESFGAANENTWAARLSMVRMFARWMSGVDPRLNEALAVDDSDIDFEGVLRIKAGKNGKIRFLPISPDTLGALDCYRMERDRILSAPDAPFFLFETGRRPTNCGARYNFAQASQAIGLRHAQQYNRHGRGPRIHDLRHTFAVRTIMNWYRRGRDPDREMIKLSTYLRPANPEATYWYIEAVPELMRLAAERAEQSIARRGAP